MHAERKKIVFLGTPAVAAEALKRLLKEEKTVQVVAVVSQPPARAVRGSGLTPSPTHQLALDNGIPVFTPETARDEKFLADLRDLKPDLCVTAAYGNVLPNDFLSIPKFGTLNIHPSLLPLYRGAAPVQRSVEDGVKVSGVSILYTVEKMDAGPIVFQQEYSVSEDVKAPQLLHELFVLGADILANGLPSVFAETTTPRIQDDSKATRAKKMNVDESWLSFNEPARKLHNKVRAFAGWPFTKAILEIEGQKLETKVVTTRVPANQVGVEPSVAQMRLAEFSNGALKVICGDGQAIEITELQVPGKKVVAVKDFWNGLKNKTIVCHERN